MIRKYLLWDERNVQNADGAVLVPGSYVKHDGILMEQDRPWEVRTDNMYLNILFDKEDGLYKMWYSPFVRFQRYPWGRECAVCYAVSRDGIHWEKPVLNIAPYCGSTANNIVARAVHGAGVRKDDHETDPARRYKMIYLNEPEIFSEVEAGRPICKLKSLRLAFSPDGLHWQWPEEAVILTRTEHFGDTHDNLFWDEKAGRYVAFTRLCMPDRVVARLESEDLVHWSGPEVVLRATPEEEDFHQPYAMPVFPYEDLYLGMVAIYHARTPEGTVDLELAVSHDTKSWKRLFPGQPLIYRGRAGAFDSHVIFGPNSPIVFDNEIRVYYAGCNGPHSGVRETGLGLARFRLDGFAAWQAEKKAILTTETIECTGSRLTVNVDCPRGYLRVATLTPDNRPVSGFELENACEIKTDSLAAEAAWIAGKNLSQLTGKKIKLQFYLTAGRIYSFSFH